MDEDKIDVLHMLMIFTTQHGRSVQLASSQTRPHWSPFNVTVYSKLCKNETRKLQLFSPDFGFSDPY